MKDEKKEQKPKEDLLKSKKKASSDSSKYIPNADGPPMGMYCAPRRRRSTANMGWCG